MCSSLLLLRIMLMLTLKANTRQVTGLSKSSVDPGNGKTLVKNRMTTSLDHRQLPLKPFHCKEQKAIAEVLPRLSTLQLLESTFQLLSSPVLVRHIELYNLIYCFIRILCGEKRIAYCLPLSFSYFTQFMSFNYGKFFVSFPLVFSSLLLDLILTKKIISQCLEIHRT